ncbi:MAG: hypothetical protein Kow0022_03210 [Phycisphaerales bacterium]
MPRLSAIHDPILADLARELRFVPRASLLRQIERAEELAGMLDREQRYPAEWVIFRITGYRPQRTDEAFSTGESLLESLSSFVERLCESAELTSESVPPGSLEIDDLCARWHVSRKKVERARREGLVARRIAGSGSRRLVFTPAAVRAYEARANPGPSPSARRMPPEVRKRIFRRAARYRRAFGWSANQCAVRLSVRFGFSAEAIRRLLRQQDERSGAGKIFDEPGPLGPREQRLALRALRRGITPAMIAERLGRDARSVRRAAMQDRLRLLRTLDLHGPASAAFDHPDADEVILSRPGVVELPRCSIPRDLRAFLQVCVCSKSSDRQSERDRAVALHLLRRRASEHVAAMSAGPVRAELLDLAETALRRASRVKRVLVHGELALLIATARRRLELDPEQLPERAAASLVDALFKALCVTVDRFDPFHGGRLAAPVSIALDRAALNWLRDNPVRVPADTRARRATVSLPEPITGERALDVWQSWLEPDARVEGVLDRLAEDEARVLRERYGLDGSWPRTIREIAGEENIRASHVVRLERRAMRHALAAARSGVG